MVGGELAISQSFPLPSSSKAFLRLQQCHSGNSLFYFHTLVFQTKRYQGFHPGLKLVFQEVDGFPDVFATFRWSHLLFHCTAGGVQGIASA
jgi:hypothetical protein